MCLAIPGRIVDVQPGNDMAMVDVAGVIRPINIGMLDGPFAVGDYVVMHSGFALERMSPEEAHAALEMLAEDPYGSSPLDSSTGRT